MATFTLLATGNWRVQVRRKARYVAETIRRRKDGEEWALEMERNIDRNGSSKPCVVRSVRTFGDLIDLHDEDMREIENPSPDKPGMALNGRGRAFQKPHSTTSTRLRLRTFGELHCQAEHRHLQRQSDQFQPGRIYSRCPGHPGIGSI